MESSNQESSLEKPKCHAPSKKEKTNSGNWLRSLNLFFCFALICTSISSPAYSQSLDQIINTLLDDDCLGLTGSVGGGIGAPGTVLDTICIDRGTGTSVASGGTGSGGGAGSAQSLGITVENRRSERLEGQEKETSNSSLSQTFQLPQGFSLFILGNFEALNKNITGFTDGFDSHIFGGTLGGDFQINDKALIGAAFTGSTQDGDFDGGGDFNTDSYGILVFGSFLPIPNAFIDLALGFTRRNHEVNRPAFFTEIDQPGGAGTSTVSTLFGGTASSDTDSNIFSIRGQAGYDHVIRLSSLALTIGPRVGLNFTSTKIDGYTETGTGGLELTYSDQSVNSFQSVVGLQGSTAISTSYGVWVPQGTANYIHEFANSQRFIEVNFAADPFQRKFRFQNDQPVRNFFNLGLGTVLILPNGLQPFVNFRAMVGNAQYSNYAGTIGIRIEG